MNFIKTAVIALTLSIATCALSNPASAGQNGVNGVSGDLEYATKMVRQFRIIKMSKERIAEVDKHTSIVIKNVMASCKQKAISSLEETTCFNDVIDLYSTDMSFAEEARVIFAVKRAIKGTELADKSIQQLYDKANEMYN